MSWNPGRKLPRDEERRRQVEVAAHRRIADAARAPRLRAVSCLTVPVRKHGPKPPQCRVAQRPAKARDVPRKERVEKNAASPSHARTVGSRRGRISECSPAPKAPRVSRRRSVRNHQVVGRLPATPRSPTSAVATPATRCRTGQRDDRELAKQQTQLAQGSGADNLHTLKFAPIHGRHRLPRRLVERGDCPARRKTKYGARTPRAAWAAPWRR